MAKNEVFDAIGEIESIISLADEVMHAILIKLRYSFVLDYTEHRKVVDWNDVSEYVEEQIWDVTKVVIGKYLKFKADAKTTNKTPKRTNDCSKKIKRKP